MASRIKSKVVMNAITDGSVSSLFQEIVDGDTGTINLDIAWDKFTKIRTHCERFLKVLDFFSKTGFINKFTNEYGAIRIFVENLTKMNEDVFSLPDISIYRNLLTEKIDNTRVPKEELKIFIDKYKMLKNCKIVNIAIGTCNNLMYHRNYIADEKNLQDKFLTHTAGNVLVLVKDLNINFKFIYNHDQINNIDKQIILTTLNKLYTISYEVYQAVSLPDIDVDQFVTIVKSSIGELRSRIPRCDQAFDKIIDSVGTLKSNFGSYYKDYIASDNPTVIMENFILDVSKETKANGILTHQFRTIIKHYKNVSASGQQDPRLRSLFKHVDSNFSQLERMNKETQGEKNANIPDAAPVDKKDDINNHQDNKKQPEEIKKKYTKTDAAKNKARRKKKIQKARRKKLDDRLENQEEHKSETSNVVNDIPKQDVSKIDNNLNVVDQQTPIAVPLESLKEQTVSSN